MTRRERLERKLERREEWAAKASGRSAAQWEKAHHLADMIPMGQPILVGHHSEGRHRRHLDKIDRAGSRGLAEHRKAEHHASKAGGLSDQLEHSIFSDDEDAIEQLEARIAEREAARERGKRVNAAWRRAGKPDPLDPEAWAPFAEKVGPEDAAFAERGLRFQRRSDVAGLFSFAKPYEPSHDGANIRRDRERIEEIRRRQKATAKAEASGGVTIERCGEGGRWCRVTFAEKPERDILNALRAAGYRWGGGSWSGRTEDLPEELGELEAGAEASPLEDEEVDPEVYACPDGARCTDPKCVAENERRRYVVKCDDCKRDLRETDSLHESAAGGLCDPCRAESLRKGSRAMEATT